MDGVVAAARASPSTAGYCRLWRVGLPDMSPLADFHTQSQILARSLTLWEYTSEATP
jgi:hypothetical protein